MTEDECRKLQEESGSFDDEMLEFIDTIFGRKIDLDEDNQMIDIDISTMKVGDTYSFMNNQKEMVEIKAVKRSRLGCNGCYLSNSELLCKGCNKSERDTNDNIMVVRIDKMDNVYRNDYPLDPGMPEGNVRHAAECMCTDRMGSMMDIDIYILKEEDRPYECHYLKDLLEDRVARIAKMHEDESYTYNMDDNYWCATCGSHSHKKDSKTGYCWYCDTVNWVKEDGKDVGI